MKEIKNVLEGERGGGNVPPRVRRRGAERSSESAAVLRLSVAQAGYCLTYAAPRSSRRARRQADMKIAAFLC